jgi:hypothetical protein
MDAKQEGQKLTNLRWLRLILVGVLLLILFWAGYKAYRVWNTVRSLQVRLNELQALAEGGADLEVESIGGTLQGAHTDLERLQSEIGFLMPLTARLGWVPKVGGDIQAAPALLEMALAVTEAGNTAFEGVEPLLALVEGEGPEGDPLALVLRTLADARPDLKAAQDQLDIASEQRAEIDLDALSDRTANLVARLDRYLPLIQTGLQGAQLLPELLGVSDQRTWLVLVQNNDELRATGGFISAVGRLVLDHGEIVEIAIEDSYAVDDFSHPYPDPPPPFRRYMGIDLWVFRDANWSPDFPTAAQAALDLYHISRDLPVDGVLAVDQHALQIVVAALGPIEIDGFPDPVTGQNVISFIRQAWSPEEGDDSAFVQWWRQRKGFMGDLIDAMRAKVESSPGEVDWLALGQAVLQILDERHLQVWLTDDYATAKGLLAEQAWDGALLPAASDYLMVVDTNMGFNKVNALIQERIDYSVAIDADGSAQATLQVQHVNPSSGTEACKHKPHYGDDYQDLVNRCYWDYLRVYTPANSRLEQATQHPIAADLLLVDQAQAGEVEVLPEEAGKTVFATFFVLPRGQETRTRFVYHLPRTTVERKNGAWQYRLLVQKQSGTRDIPLRVVLTLPPGAEVTSLSAGGRQPEPGQVVFRTKLNEDQVFEVFFRLTGENT